MVWDNQTIGVAVEDGGATITIGGIHFTLSDDDVIDLGQRLIAWAGVAATGVGVAAISVRRARKLISPKELGLPPALDEREKASLAEELEALHDAVDALAAGAGVDDRLRCAARDVLKFQESAGSPRDPGTGRRETTASDRP